jgi:hypothetical protein
MATSSRIKPRGLDLSSRHELLAKATDLDRDVLQALLPEHGLQAQVQVVDVADRHAARLRLLETRSSLIEMANEQDPMLIKLGGGVRDLCGGRYA